MANQLTICTEENMRSAVAEARVPEIWECLWKGCSEPFRRRIARDSGSNDLGEDVFWESVRALAERAKQQSIQLSSSVCAYFYGFMKNYWKKLQEKAAKQPPNLSLDGCYDLIGDPDEIPIIAMLKAERLDALRACLDEVLSLDEKFPVIIAAFFEGKKDEEIMGTIGYSSRTGVSVARARCFQKLRETMNRRFPGLLDPIATTHA